MDPTLKTLLKQIVTLKGESGRNSSGDPAFGNARPIKAYYERRRKIVEMPTGEKLEASHWICTEDEIKNTDRLWLQEEDSTDDDQSHTVASVERFVDDHGNVDHYETWVF